MNIPDGGRVGMPVYSPPAIEGCRPGLLFHALKVHCSQCFSCEKYFPQLRKIKVAFCLHQPIMNNNFGGTGDDAMGKHPRRAERPGHSGQAPSNPVCRLASGSIFRGGERRS